MFGYQIRIYSKLFLESSQNCTRKNANYGRSIFEYALLDVLTIRETRVHSV